jgi:uncharacterized Fe-S cluster-containing radical SAM superfamily protein
MIRGGQCWWLFASDWVSHSGDWLIPQELAESLSRSASPTAYGTVRVNVFELLWLKESPLYEALILTLPA